MSRRSISIVVPALNEEECLAQLHPALVSALAPTGYDWELIIVDDGSTDRTAEVIADLVTDDPRVRGVHLARNFGQQYALLAGIAEARGDAVVTMDADLEQPPAAIAEMIELWEQGYQVVHGVRRDHPRTGLIKRVTSRWFYKLFRFLSRIPMEPGMLDFRLMDRAVVDAVLSMNETDFFLRGITTWIGFKQARLPYQAGLRTAGKTKYSLGKMFGFAMRGITSFSTFPLRLATYLGVAMTFLSLAYGVYVGVRYFFWEHPQPGYASTILLISFLMGVQFLLIGALGEYVGRIHVEVKRRPRYLIARRTEAERSKPGARVLQEREDRAP
jgi:dolichol-phosphate mannosyltransferase